MATFEFDGDTVRVIPQHELSLGDLAYIKESFDIPGLVELENGMADLEPQAWRAILMTSIRRVRKGVDPKTDAIDDVALLPLIMAMNEEREAQMAAEAEARKKGRARPTGASKASSPAGSGRSSSA